MVQTIKTAGERGRLATDATRRLVSRGKRQTCAPIAGEPKEGAEAPGLQGWCQVRGPESHGRFLRYFW